MHKLIFPSSLLLFALIFFGGVDTVNAQDCHVITGPSNMPATNDYAPPYDVNTSNQLMIRVGCGTSGGGSITVGTGNSNHYIYNTAHVWRGSSWSATTLSGTTRQTNWIEGVATGSLQTAGLTAGTNYFVAAHFCTWTGGQWRCGCADTACATPRWNVQVFRTGTGSGVGGNPNMPPASCQSNTGGLQMTTRDFGQGAQHTSGGGGRLHYTIGTNQGHAFRFTHSDIASVHVIQWANESPLGGSAALITTISRCPGDFSNTNLPQNCVKTGGVGAHWLYYEGMPGANDNLRNIGCHIEPGQNYYLNFRIDPQANSSCMTDPAHDCAYHYDM